jgi:RHS repeat-associated protein
MAGRLARLLVAFGLLLGVALPSAAAAVVRLPTSQEIAASFVPAHGADPAYASSYFGARYLRTGSGRLTTVDPVMTSAHLTNPQTFNRYAYARNNPLRYVDPDGRDVSKECIADKKCTIELKVNVVYDQRNPLSAAQKASVEKAYLAKAQADFKHSNIKIDYRYTEGLAFESGGQIVVEGARSDSLNAVFTTGREATIMPGGSLSARGVTFLNVAQSGQGESNVFLWSNTFEHEMGHVMRHGYVRLRPDRQPDVAAGRQGQIAATGLANLPTLTYTYDDTGNVTGIADPRAGHSATFTYDSRDRLETAAGGGWGTLVYGYDAVGNRTSKTSNGATTIYGYAAQRLTATTGAETATLGYDANGNQTADPVATYTYTPANMLEMATLGAGAVYTYRYDGDNQRALKFEGSTTTTYYLRGAGQALSEFEEQGGQLRWTRDQVYLGAQLLAAARPPAGTTVLTIGKAGAGAGTVSSAPTGIDCGPTCGGATAAFAAGAVVSLSAAAASGWVFVGWSGEPDCADGVVTLTDAKTCVATFALTAPLFAKQSPMNGGTSVARRVTLQWAAVPNAAYMVCWDTVNNGVCDTAWQGNGAATSRVVAFPENATYFWQVKTYTGTEADDGTWWSVTVTGPPLFTKIAPANGASGLGSALTLQWTAVPGEGYWVCWDTIDNGTCDTTWSRNGAMTAKVVTGLMSATYYWPFDLGDPRALRAIPSDVAVAAESRGGRGRRRTAACWRTTGRGTTSRWARVWAAPLAGAWKSSAALR